MTITKTIPQNTSILEAELFPTFHGEKSDKSQDAQTTNLNQQHTKELTPDIVCIHDRSSKKPCHTDHRDSSKKMIQIACLGTSRLHPRQTE